ncbi:hypothetical protein TFLX_04755 [Thermoflexales bacterium]|nr:hypothetical protein TFLX_04755 [Thermoflexales bacterium]
MTLSDNALRLIRDWLRASRKLTAVILCASLLAACRLPTTPPSPGTTNVASSARALTASLPGVDCTSVGIPTGDVIVNGGFEAGEDGWTVVSSGTGSTWQAHALIGSSPSFQPHSGMGAARLGGYEGSRERLSQHVVIPADGVLTYWWAIGQVRPVSQFSVSLVSSDRVDVVEVVRHRHDDSASGWWQDCWDLAAYAGQEVSLVFEVFNDNYTMTFFDLDNVVLGSRKAKE